MVELTRREELLLLAILKLEHNAYLITLRKHIRDITGKSINYGSLCNTLSALTRKGYIKSAESNPVARPGGRRKVLYSLTTDGRRALIRAHKIQKLVWDGWAELIIKDD